MVAVLPLRISPEQVTNVFQKLSDLSNGNANGNEELPSDIHAILCNFHLAQVEFINKIDEYMHKNERHISEVTTVETIVNVCPQFLLSKGVNGDLPIHCAASDIESALTFVPILAKYGSIHGVGEGRSGGLLEEGHNQWRPIVKLARLGSLGTVEAIANIEPQLIDLKQLVANDVILINAVVSNNFEMVKWLTELSPQGLFSFSKVTGRLPIHCSQTLKVFKYLLQSGMKHRPSDDVTMGGLFHIDKSGLSAIDHMKLTFEERSVFRCINQVLSSYKHIPLIHHAIKLVPNNLEEIILYCPQFCFTCDSRGRLPVQIALENGMKWSGPLVSLMNANMERIGDLDPVTGFCPSALAAMHPSSDLDTIYHLLRMYPRHVEVGIVSKLKKE